MRNTRHFLLLASIALLTVGCGPKNFANDNDVLRAENLKLQRDLQLLQKQLNLAQNQIQTLQATNTNLPGVVPPAPVGLNIDRYSGPVDSDQNGFHDVLRLYLIPVDQHGRMIPVAGSLQLSLIHLPDGGAPSVLRTQSLDPDQLDAAYRDGFTGPYYHLEFDLQSLELPSPPMDQLTVRCVLQLATGGTLRAQAQYRIARRPGA